MKYSSLFIPIFFFIVTLIFPFPFLQVVTYTLIFIYLLSWTVSRYFYQSLHIERDRDTYYCFHMDRESTVLKISNRSLFPIEDLIIHDMGNGCYSTGEGLFLESLLSKESKKLTTIINSDSRGTFDVGPISIKGRDPFNLFPWQRIVENHCQVVIYPKIRDIDLLLLSGSVGGNRRVKSSVYEDSTDLKTIRDFRSGDSLKNVNWRVSARVGKLHVMEYNNSISTPLVLLMNINPNCFGIKNRYNYIERILEAAASLIYEFGKRGAEYFLYATDRDHPTMLMNKGEEGITHLLEYLSRVDIQHINMDLEDLITSTDFKPPNGAHIYVLTPILDRPLVDMLTPLCHGDIRINWVMCYENTPAHYPEKGDIYYLHAYGEEMLNDR